MTDTAVEAETFTERCRRLLTEQPNQAEFTVSRAGLETLVLDNERYAALNREAVQRHLERRRLSDLSEQVEKLRARYPDAHLDPTEFGHSLLWVPGVKRPAKIWKNAEATLVFIIPNGFPYNQPDRFLTSADDTLLKHGYQASDVLGSVSGAPRDLIQWYWEITPTPQNTLLDHVNAARRRFEFGNASEREDA